MNILYFLRVVLLSISFFVEVLCLITVSFLAFSVLLRAEELSPVDCCLVVLADSAFWPDRELEAGLELTVSDDDLLLVTVLCLAVEFVLALVLPSTLPVERLVVPLSDPADCLLGAASEACLLLLLFPVDMLDALSGCTLAYMASPSCLCSGRE